MAEKQTNKDRMREIVDSIENGIKELFESDKYRKYLATMSRFHRYSVNNTMLIYMQRPDATHVAGFNKWRDQFGRNVLKGEKGIRIIAPTPYKKKVEEIKTDPETNAPILDADGKAIIEEKEIRIPMFKVVSVFDVSQTAGKPLPQLAADLSGNVQQYEVFMEALRRASPVPMEIKPIVHDTDGFFSIKAQSITIRAGMSEVQTVCAAVHEIAHAKLHDYEHMTELADDGETILVPGEKSRNTEEVEAESIFPTMPLRANMTAPSSRLKRQHRALIRRSLQRKPFRTMCSQTAQLTRASRESLLRIWTQQTRYASTQNCREPSKFLRR